MDARYLAAMPVVLDIEKAWSNSKYDTGQETVFGISRKWHPKEIVWHYVDALAAEYGRGTSAFIAAVNASHDIHAAVMEFYERVFWIPSHAGDLPTPLHLIVFDLAVNSGLSGAARVVDSTACALGHADDALSGIAFLATYGDVGVSTTALLKARKRYYQTIVKNNPKQAPNYTGWMNRLRRIAQVATGSVPTYLDRSRDNVIS